MGATSSGPAVLHDGDALEERLPTMTLHSNAFDENVWEHARMVRFSKTEWPFSFEESSEEDPERRRKEFEAEQRRLAMMDERYCQELARVERRAREEEERWAAELQRREDEQKAQEESARTVQAKQEEEERRAQEERTRAEMRKREEEQRAREAEERQAREKRLNASRLEYIRTYSMFFLKLAAGLSRLLFEDVLNLFVQFAFSIKLWHTLSASTRVFTLSSVVVGLTLALFGPVKDWLRCRRARLTAVASGVDVRGVADVALTPSETLPLVDAEVPRGPSFQNVQQVQSETVGQPIVLYQGTILRYITEGTAEHSVVAHRLLVLSSILYWGSTAAIPLMFGNQIKGGPEAGVPQSAVLYFALVTISSLLVELWIAVHTKDGLHLLLNVTEVFRKAFWEHEYKEIMTLVAILQSLFGRYDTFCDAVFTCILWNTEPITMLRFDSLGGYTVHLRWPLLHVSVFSLVVGIFGFQCIPGVVFLVTKKGLPAAFKLNEFNFLLGMVEYQI